MLYNFFIFLPAALGLFWMIIHRIMVPKSRTFKITQAFLGTLTLFVFADSCYADPNTPPIFLLVGCMLAMLTLPSILPLSVIYLRRLLSEDVIKWPRFVWLVIPAALFSTALTLALLAGPDHIADMLSDMLSGRNIAELRANDTLAYAFHFTTVTACLGSLAIEVLVESISLLILMIRNNLRPRHFRKFFKGSHIRVVEIQFFLLVIATVFMFAKALLPRELLMAQPWISMVLSFFLTSDLFLFSYVAMFGAKRSITLREMRLSFRYNYGIDEKAEAEEEMLADMVAEADLRVLRATQERILHRQQLEELRQQQHPDDVHGSLVANIYAAVSKSWDDDSLHTRFERYIFGEKGFLEPGITLQSVSERLHSNKTYISRLVNTTYSLAFPDLINALRIDYAQQYILSHPDARQDEVARESGFLGASAFNITFKKVVGMTPKVWVATHAPVPEKP